MIHHIRRWGTLAPRFQQTLEEYLQLRHRRSKIPVIPTSIHHTPKVILDDPISILETFKETPLSPSGRLDTPHLIHRHSRRIRSVRIRNFTRHNLPQQHLVRYPLADKAREREEREILTSKQTLANP